MYLVLLVTNFLVLIAQIKQVTTHKQLLAQSSMLLTIGASLTLLAAAGLVLIQLSGPLSARIHAAKATLCDHNLVTFCADRTK